MRWIYQYRKQRGTMADQQGYLFHLGMKGSTSVNAVDLANSIIATSQVVQELSEIRYGSEASKDLHINVSVFKEGSVNTHFLLEFADVAIATAPVLLPYARDVCKVGKELMDLFKLYIDIKKALQGKPPAEVKAIDNTMFQITGNTGCTFNIDANGLRVLQSKSVSSGVEKIMAPMTKEDSTVEAIEVKSVSCEENEFTVPKQ